MFALHTLHRTPRLEARHTRTAPPARGARRTTRNGAEHARYLTKAFMLLCITGRLLSPGLDNLTGNSTGTRQELDSSTPRRMVPASTSLEHRLGRNSRQELDTELARQARPRQRLDSVPRQRLDSASTEPRQLDSSTTRAQGGSGTARASGAFGHSGRYRRNVCRTHKNSRQYVNRIAYPAFGAEYDRQLDSRTASPRTGNVGYSVGQSFVHDARI